MAIELERKFLVKGEYKSKAFRSSSVVQGYISSDPSRSVRVRIADDKGFLTIKGKSDELHIGRYEWERALPLNEALELLELCEPGVISKTRYFVKEGDFTFEVDEFCGDNSPLVIAEIELHSSDQQIPAPEWLGREVTGDLRYYNSYLAGNPYSKWDKQ